MRLFANNNKHSNLNIINWYYFFILIIQLLLEIVEGVTDSILLLISTK